MKSNLYSILAIAASAIPGTLLAWWLAKAMGLTGIGQALITAFMAMVLSVALFAGLIAAGRALKILR